VWSLQHGKSGVLCSYKGEPAGALGLGDTKAGARGLVGSVAKAPRSKPAGALGLGDTKAGARGLVGCVAKAPRSKPAGALGLGDTKARFTPTPVLHDLEVTTAAASYRAN